MKHLQPGSNLYQAIEGPFSKLVKKSRWPRNCEKQQWHVHSPAPPIRFQMQNLSVHLILDQKKVAKWRAQDTQRNFCLINYSLDLLIAIPVLLQLSVFFHHHHEENEVSYAVWLSCSKYVDYSLSEWLICVYAEVKFSKDRVKIQIWCKLAIFFSWAMSVHNEIHRSW